MPPSLTSTYLLPAILLNPAGILHGFNTVMYRTMSNPPVGSSQHQWLERLGPAASAGHYFDVHDNEQMCWWYTFVMVIVQIFAYGKVNDTRVRNKSARAAAKAAKADRLEKGKPDGLSIKTNGHADYFDGAADTPTPTLGRKSTNGHISAPVSVVMADVSDTDESNLETSSEEEIVH